jgi:hypothetical protein
MVENARKSYTGYDLKAILKIDGRSQRELGRQVHISATTINERLNSYQEQSMHFTTLFIDFIGKDNFAAALEKIAERDAARKRRFELLQEQKKKKN